MNLNIKDEELTFVVQGPIDATTNLKSVQELMKDLALFFPNSPIIISTWDCVEAKRLPGDVKVVINQDPGAEIVVDKTNTLNNVNREIISTINGLKEVRTRYSVKLRSDLRVRNSGILKALNSRPSRVVSTVYDVLQEFVLITNVTTVNPRYRMRLPHHPCNWFFAGLTTDLRKIWGIPLMPLEWFRWFESNPWPKDNWHQESYLSLYRPESYIWSSFIRSYKSLVFSHCFDSSEENVRESEAYLARNLQMLTNHKLGIYSSKHKNSKVWLANCYTPKEWKAMQIQRGIDVKDIWDLESIFFHLIRRYQSSIHSTFSAINTCKFYLSFLFKSQSYSDALRKIHRAIRVSVKK